MDSAWSRVFRGLALAFDGLSELSEPQGEVQTSAEPQGAPQEATAPPESAVAAFLSDLAQQIAGRRAEGAPADPGAEVNFMVDQALAAGEPTEELPAPTLAEAPLHSTHQLKPITIPAAENGVPLQPCPELDRQHREVGRREKLRESPVNALSVVSYWLGHLMEQPARAEEWTRCVECVPGSASARFVAVVEAGTSEMQLYATYFDECVGMLKNAQAKADKMREFIGTIDGDEAIDPGDLLDADRVGRILFWLGDRPDIEALTDAPAPTGEVGGLGPDHIPGPRGSTLQPSADDLVTLEELEQLHPLPDDERTDAFGSGSD